MYVSKENGGTEPGTVLNIYKHPDIIQTIRTRRLRWKGKGHARQCRCKEIE